MRAVLALAFLLGGLAPALGSGAPAAVAAAEGGFWRTVYGDLGEVGPDAAEGGRAFVLGLGDRIAPAAESSFEVRSVKNSLAATHVGLQQLWRDVPVEGAVVALHVVNGRAVALHSRAVVELDARHSTIGAEEARAAAQRAAPGVVAGVREATVADGLVARPSFEVTLDDGGVPARFVVQVARATGEVFAVHDRARGFTAQGHAWTNPIVESGDPDLRDGPRVTAGVGGLPAVTPAPDFSPYYREVELLDLEEGPRGPELRGPHAQVVGSFAAGEDMRYGRDDPRFEEVMLYHWIDVSQRFVQALGFHDVVNFSLPLYVRGDAGFGGVGGYGAGATCDGIWFGSSSPHATVGGPQVSFQGFSDSGEDADVILHEYGHTIQCNQMTQPFPHHLLAEGWGDYWASTQMARVIAPPYDTCMGEWVTSYLWTPRMGSLPCARDVRNTMAFSNGTYEAEPHERGQIWSGALWDLRDKLGPEAADRLALEANFFLPSEADLREGAEALLLADFGLTGGAAGAAIGDVFASRNVTQLRVTSEMIDAIRGAPLATADTPEPLAVPSVGALAFVSAVALLAVARRRRE